MVPVGRGPFWEERLLLSRNGAVTPVDAPVALLFLGRALAGDVYGPVKDSLGPTRPKSSSARVGSGTT